MPNRSKRFTQSLLTGYGAIGVNILFSLASVPLALSYLSKEEFGLWALALQITGYLALIDMGMTGAVGRFLADHKDDVNSEAYTSHLATGILVFLVQSLLIVFMGMIFAYFAPSLFLISPELSNEFTFLLQILSLIAGISIASRCLAAPLWGFQRMDVINLAATAGLIVQFLCMWLGFHLGYGVRSFVLAGAAPTLLAIVAYAVVCSKNGYYPRRKGWFSPRWVQFKEMFRYGRDGMLLSIGVQLVNATQIAIVSRILGLDAAATFSIATKLYNMSIQLLLKVVESAAPGLAEMFVRGQTVQFTRRYWDMILITIATSSAGAVAMAAGNSAFIAIWTGGEVKWSIHGDLLLGLMVLARSLSGCMISFFGITKNLKPVRIVYFIEGIIFVPTAFWAAKSFGVEGVMAASLIVHLMVAFAASARAASKMLGSMRRIILPMALISFGIAVGSLVAWATSSLGLSPISRLAWAIVPLSITLAIAWKTILPKEIQSRFNSQLSTWMMKVRS